MPRSAGKPTSNATEEPSGLGRRRCGTRVRVRHGPDEPCEYSRPAGEAYGFKAEGGLLHALGGRHGEFVLTLRNPGAGAQHKLKGFVRDWKRNGFRRNPPSAAVVVVGALEDRDVQILELRRPRLLRGGGIRFRARVDKAAAHSPLRRFQGRADSRLDSRFGEVRLFIDSTRLATITITFQALPPIVTQQKFVATFTNASFAAAGEQGNTVTLDGGAHVELRGDQVAVQSGSYYPVAGGISFQLVTLDPFITGSVANLPPGMSGYFIAGPDVLVPLKAGSFKFNYQ
jgi:hypothetical protein